MTSADRSPDPVLHVLAGPNGAGKTTFVNRVLEPATHLPFVNADLIALQRWPRSVAEHAYDAARLAATERDRLMATRQSFITETVFSHASKVDLIRTATGIGFHVYLHVVIVPEETTVARVAHRVRHGGHTVPEQKIRERYERLWDLVVRARDLAERTRIYDNSTARNPFRLVASYDHGRPVGAVDWPRWAPRQLT